MISAIRKFLKEEDGITALEYGVLAAVVATAVVATFNGPNGISVILGNLLTEVTTAATLPK